MYGPKRNGAFSPSPESRNKRRNFMRYKNLFTPVKIDQAPEPGKCSRRPKAVHIVKGRPEIRASQAL